MARDRRDARTGESATSSTSLTSLAERMTGPRPTNDDWFGPGKPLDPSAPPDVRGRMFDFPVSTNINYRPRGESSETGITFETLRRVAEPAQGGLDLLRLAIETRKDQMAGQQWCIKGRDGTDGGAAARKIELALRRPDGVSPFLQWQRMLIEDCLVIDAMAVYYRPTGVGKFLVEAMDAATLKRLIDGSGRVPRPPDPAYQQILKGLPAVDYTLEELTYSIRNPRTNRVYGFSPVEQVIGIVNLALRRQLHITQYYTEGNVPETLIGVPESWNPEQISAFQSYWDALLEGNTAERRHAKFIPGGMEPHPTKDPELKGELDDWLASVICFALSIPRQALIKPMNRASAGTDQQIAQDMGLEPFKLTWKDFMDEVLERGFVAPELEYGYNDEEIADPKIKADVVSAYVQAKVITKDEARDMLGLDPMTPEQEDELNPPPPVMAPGVPAKGGGAAAANGAPPNDPADTEKLAKAVVAELLKKKASRRSTATVRPPSAP